MDAMHRLSYGLFLLTAKSKAGTDNGCILNTVMQITDSPKRVIVAINKANLTHDLVLEVGTFCISILTEQTPFKVFEQYGFTSGRTADKFAQSTYPRDNTGNIYINDYANAYISGKVVASHDCGTHTLFIADVTESSVLSDIPSVTYQYYFDRIKPAPKLPNTAKSAWVCNICGYVYEGDALPEDYVCPICKHGAEAFEPS